jgi:hypothetical protein
VVLVQHYREGWPASAVAGFLSEKDGIKVFVDEAVHNGRSVFITLRHKCASGTWVQSFTTETLSQTLESALECAALSFEGHLDQDRTWLLARPMPMISAKRHWDSTP